MDSIVCALIPVNRWNMLMGLDIINNAPILTTPTGLFINKKFIFTALIMFKMGEFLHIDSVPLLKSYWLSQNKSDHCRQRIQPVLLALIVIDHLVILNDSLFFKYDHPSFKPHHWLKEMIKQKRSYRLFVFCREKISCCHSCQF